jgi:hypothetical protein
VIQARRFARRLQRVVHLLRRLDGRRIDQHCALRRLHQRHGAFELVGFARHLFHPQVQVGPIRTGVDHALRRDVQLLRDIVGNLRRGGGRERQDHRAAQGLQRWSDFQESGPEVVPPLRDAMGFVDHQQADRMLAQLLQETRFGQPFGCDHDDARAAIGQGVLCRARFLAIDRAIELHRGDAHGPQRFALVLHQRDQGRNHHGAGRQKQRRQLIAKRFARACGHDGQGVPTSQHAIDDPIAAPVEAGSARRFP